MLSDFQVKVSAKIYCKFNYDKWKRIQRKIKESIEPIRLCKNELGYIITFPDGTDEVFNYNDKSFGSYLLDTLGKDFDMEYNSNQSSKTFNNNNSYITTTANTPYTISSNDYTTLNIDSYGTIGVTQDFGTISFSGFDDLNTKTKSLEEKINKCITQDDIYPIVEKENSKMTGFNFDFGPCSSDHVRLSMYGLAVKNAAGTWVSYNSQDGSVIDVDVFNFNGARFLYKMPVAIKDIAVGDIVVHNRVPMFVTKVDADTAAITAVDVRAGEVKSIIPTRNMFGFNFVTKIVSLFNMTANAPSTDAPFGNMLPWLMMGESGEMDPMMVMLMMNQSGAVDFSNPMMMYLMMKNEGATGSNMQDLMMTMAIMNQMNK